MYGQMRQRRGFGTLRRNVMRSAEFAPLENAPLTFAPCCAVIRGRLSPRFRIGIAAKLELKHDSDCNGCNYDDGGCGFEPDGLPELIC